MRWIMQDFLAVFKKNKGAKPIAKNDIRVPDFNDKNLKWDSHTFVLWGDASEIDFSNAGDKLPYIRFSSETKFPSADKMPKGFNPQQVLENGKAPGLNIADLHTMGITGKGLTIAIIDKTLNTEHAEIKDNIIHYETIGYPENTPAEYHGNAVSSLLAGKSVGVAPEAKIVYFAATAAKLSYPIKNNKRIQEELRQYCPANMDFDGIIKDIISGRYSRDKEFQQQVDIFVRTLPENIKSRLFRLKREVDFVPHARALKKILFMNARLPQDKKISAVSISWGRLYEDPECKKLIQQLIESGVAVFTTADSKIYYGNKAKYITIDRKMNADPDTPESYTAGFWRNNKLEDCLLVPAGGRTVAGFHSNTDYIYCGIDAGMSWAAPYLTGVYALAKQIAPNLTPHHFFEIAQQTAVSNGQTGNNKIIQPQRIIQYLQNEMILQQQQTVSRGM